MTNTIQKSDPIVKNRMTNITPSPQTFFSDNPEIQKYIREQAEKGDFPAEYTPNTVEIKFEGLTYIRYDSGEITASRECTEGYNPPFWEVYFDEDELAIFVLGKGNILMDRTTQMAELDKILNGFTLHIPKSSSD